MSTTSLAGSTLSSEFRGVPAFSEGYKVQRKKPTDMVAIYRASGRVAMRSSGCPLEKISSLPNQFRGGLRFGNYVGDSNQLSLLFRKPIAKCAVHD